MSETSDNKVVEIATGFPVPSVGERFAGGEVVWVSLPSRKVVLKMDTDTFGALAEEPSVKSVRAEKTFGVADWFPKPLDYHSMFVPGDTFPLIGVGEDVLRRGNYGSGVVAAVGDTGCDF